MDALQKIVKVTQQQYDTLKNGGTVGGYTGLNTSYLYLVQEDYNDITYANLNSTASLGTIGTTPKLYAIGIDTSGKLAVNVPWTDTHVSHDHSVGVGLVGSGNAGTSGGTYTYKAKLRSETALTEDSAAATTTSGRVYPVAVDKSGYLSVNVPWKNTNTASAVDNILDGSHSGTKITYAPYAAQQSKLSFDTSTSAPTITDRLNLNGYLYVTKFNVAGKAAVQYNSTEDCIEFIFA